VAETFPYIALQITKGKPKLAWPCLGGIGCEKGAPYIEAVQESSLHRLRHRGTGRQVFHLDQDLSQGVEVSGGIQVE